jgi:hypothetical protein
MGRPDGGVSVQLVELQPQKVSAMTGKIQRCFIDGGSYAQR